MPWGGGVSVCSTIEYEIYSTLVQSNIFQKKKKNKKRKMSIKEK